MKQSPPTAACTITLLFVSFILLGMPGAVTSVGWPEIRDEFNLRQDSIGWLLIACTVGHLISGAFNGRLMAWLGNGPTMLLSITVYSGGLFGFWLATSWPMMVLFGLIGGWGSGTLDATGNTIAAARYNERIMNWLHACFGVGATLGPLMIALVVSTGSNWRGGALVFALLLAILAVVLALLRPFANYKPDTHINETNIHEERNASSLQTLSKMVVWIAILFFFFYTGLEVTIGQWTFTLFTESRELSADLARMWVSIYWGTFAAGRFMFGLISHWFSVNRWLRICLFGTLVSVLLLMFPNEPGLGVLGLALSGLTQAPIFATLISHMPKLVGRNHAANAIGYVVGASGIGLALLPWLAGMLAEQFSLEAIPPLILGTAIVLCLLFEALIRVDASRISMTKVILSGYISVPDSDLNAVRQALPMHVSATKSEPGCLVFDVEEDTCERGRFNVYEEFVDQEAFEKHQRRVRESEWGNISRNVQRHYSVQGLK